MLIRTFFLSAILSIFINYGAFSQVDSTFTLKLVNDTKDSLPKSVITLDLHSTVLSLLKKHEAYGFGFSYEQLVHKNKSLVLTGKGHKIANIFSMDNFLAYEYTAMLEYRMYRTYKKVSSFEADGRKYDVKVRDYYPVVPTGFYLGFVALHRRFVDRLRSNESNTGLGISLGYQHLFRNKYILNLSMPLAITYDVETFENHSTESDFSVFIEANIGFGIAF